MSTQAISNSQFLEKLCSSDSVEALRKDCKRACRRVGIIMNSYHHYPPLGAVDFTDQLAIFADGFPEHWVKRYAEQRYDRCDPIVKRALNSTSAFWWSSVYEDHLDGKEASYIEDLRAQGFGNGLAVPVFGPNDRNGYIGLGIGTDEKVFDEADIMRLQTFCNAAHLHYCELSRKQRTRISLSPREHQTMKLVARGFTAQDIAEKMNVTASTIDTNLRRIYEKLDVHNRVAATLRCLALGYLHT
ncbi:MAG: LuxR family transcriptional regulator [Pseudomonadota bacterium]